MRKFIRTFILSITLGLGLTEVNASPQMPDYLIFEGDTIAFYRLILEEYFNAQNRENEGDLFGLKFRAGSSTSCWRGYQAIYELSNDSLFLRHITSCGELHSKSGIDINQSNLRIKKTFGDQLINGKVHLNWFTGDISLPSGDLLRWDGVFYHSFEEEKIVSIDNGRVTNTTRVMNYIDEPNRLNRRYDDTLSTLLFNELQKANWSNVNEFDCSEKYLITIDKKGEIADVVMAEYQTKKEIKEFWDMPEYNYCIRTIKSRLEHLKFDILKRAGKPIEEQVYLEIWVEDNGTLENWTN
ncbi:MULTISPECIES: hypothetical protein [unclassified Imperialibacter]|uniref:hypothetical protein n=1 Tax=unclassified Imperialibacter TaxID=2629706 RepID=UPI0012517B82|nr:MULTISPECIES: hypothetical protein [unclassified Imperialibacter]CAD5249673.1 conserved hypothetical protein [Imperialibacter sp. 89]CAD5264929.1 conserved hypothetical protein [Imperialibacter sp. 75]VVT06503.1 conserved hypothetical protein [Imperialibacter sp. EC-SDR9]